MTDEERTSGENAAEETAPVKVDTRRSVDDHLATVLSGIGRVDPIELTLLDAQIEADGERTVEKSIDLEVDELREQLEARKPEIFAAVDSAGLAVKDAFTQSIRVVYQLALLLTALAFLLTLKLPQHPLRTSMGVGPPPSAE